MYWSWQISCTLSSFLFCISTWCLHKIFRYLESRPQHWRPNHSVIVKDIENVNKMKMALYVTHTINFQNYGDKNSRRSDLVLELKKSLEDLSIKYHLLPQEVHLSKVKSEDSMVRIERASRWRVQGWPFIMVHLSYAAQIFCAIISPWLIVSPNVIPVLNCENLRSKMVWQTNDMVIWIPVECNMNGVSSH